METDKIIENLRIKLKNASNSYQLLLHKTYNEALVQNELQTKHWQDYQTEHEELSINLLTMRDKLSHTIMVPVGKKALMRGSLVHTNEILVCLGDGWFVKQSAKQAADICKRRLQYCDDMLKKLQNERDLLTSRKSFTLESEAFNEDQTQEIIEPYDEEAEKQWKDRHRQKQKEYYQKVAELKRNQKTKIETEEDIWNRLDALDLQEELEDELNRMDEDIEDEDEELEDEDSSLTSGHESDSGQNNLMIEADKIKPLKRRVSFKEDNENDRNKKTVDNNENNDDFIRITFKHSDMPSHVPSNLGNEVTSPADIHINYLSQKMPKSILKPSQSGELSLSEDTDNPFIIRQVEELQQSTKSVVQAIGEVVERTTTSTAQISQRPVSQFKAARMANKK